MMQFLVTSLAAQAVNQFDAYFELQNISAEQTLFVNGVFFISGQQPSLFHHDTNENRVSFCLSGDEEERLEFVEAYDSNTLLDVEGLTTGCGMVDFSENSLVWLEEATGRNPIWFATSMGYKEKKKDRKKALDKLSFIFSDDYIIVDNVGSHYVSTFPSGNIMQLALDTFDLLNLKPLTRATTLPLHLQSSLEEFHARLAVEEALEPFLINQDEYTFVVEYDPKYYSSRLLLCLLHKMNIPVRVIRTIPSYLDFEYDAYNYDSYYRQLLDFLPSLKVQVNSHLVQTTHQQYSAQRRHACRPIDLVTSQDKKKLVLLSHLIALDAHPLEFYYQNMLCQYYDTTLLYPFQNHIFHDLLLSRSQGDFNVFVEKIFLQNDECPVIQDDEIRVVTIEAEDEEDVDDYETNEASKYHNGSWVHRLLENPTKSLQDLMEDPSSTDAYYRRKPIVVNDKPVTLTASVSEAPATDSMFATVKIAVKGEDNYIFDVNNAGDIYDDQEENDSDHIQDVTQETWITSIESKAALHAQNNTVFLLLATQDYFDLLHNFFCSVASLFENNNENNGNDTSTRKLPFLILTNDNSIADLARYFGAGVVSSSPIALELLHKTHSLVHRGMPGKRKITGADFGSTLYQTLMLSRSQTALALLQTGFHTIIADIDTVWRQNPLHFDGIHQLLHHLAVDEQEQEDIGVVKDGQEYCGCFVVLRGSSAHAQLFWGNVTLEHESMVIRAIERLATASKETMMEKDDTYDESEQKIITYFLTQQNAYSGHLRVKVLSKVAFPDGLSYFHEWKSRNDAVVIHNNFIIGKFAKYNRFERYNLWFYRPPLVNTGNDISHAIGTQWCHNLAFTLKNGSSGHSNWSKLFSNMRKPSHVSSVEVVLPIHNYLSTTGKIRVLVLSEGIFDRKNRIHSQEMSMGMSFNQAETLSLLSMFQLSTIQIPTTSSAIRTLTVRSFPTSTTQKNTIHLVDPIPEPIVQVFTDFQAKTISDKINSSHSYWSLDFAHNKTLIALAQERVQNQSLVDLSEDKLFRYTTRVRKQFIKNKLREKPKKISETMKFQTLQEQISRMLHSAETQIVTNATEDKVKPKEQCIDVQYRITVLTMTRLLSLQRLLSSLAAADYLLATNITLDVHVDVGRSLKENMQREEILRFLQTEFTWPHGHFLVTDIQYLQANNSNNNNGTSNKKNIGLKGQWQWSWSPETWQEVNFVFEDDLEVSPHYFLWTQRVVQQYYACDLQQRLHHQRLLTDVFSLVTLPTATSSSVSIKKEEYENTLTKFMDTIAGFPLLYGICLQRQNLAPNHRHGELSSHVGTFLQTGFRPFAYSLIGSWGPLFFPGMWQAFRLWWYYYDEILQEDVRLKMKLPPTTTETLETNEYLRRNPNIWTPYIIRFAFETSAKCLYAPFFLTSSSSSSSSSSSASHSTRMSVETAALVINHREEGENYGLSMGADAKLLTDLPPKLNEISSSIMINNNTHNRNSNWFVSEAQSQSFWSLPTLQELSNWQYDFNLRRSGSTSLIDATVLPTTGYSPMLKRAFLYYYQRKIDKISEIFVEMQIFAEIWEMLQRHLLPQFHYQHLLFLHTVTPIFPLMLSYTERQNLPAHFSVVDMADCAGDVTNDEYFDAIIGRLKEHNYFHCNNINNDNNIGNTKPAVTTMILPLNSLSSSLETFLFHNDISSYILRSQVDSDVTYPRYLLVTDTLCHAAPFIVQWGNKSYIQVERICDTLLLPDTSNKDVQQKKKQKSPNNPLGVSHFREMGGILYRLHPQNRQKIEAGLMEKHVQVIQRLTPTLTRSRFVSNNYINL